MRLPLENGDLEERQAGLTVYKPNQLNGVAHSGPSRNSGTRALRNTKRVQRSLDARTHFKRSSPGLKLNKVKQNPNSELTKKQVPSTIFFL